MEIISHYEDEFAVYATLKKPLLLVLLEKRYKILMSWFACIPSYAQIIVFQEIELLKKLSLI